jgi:hypothetical protein
VELLEQITSGEVVHSRAGQYLDSLRHRLPGSVVADMLCLLQIHLELSMRAKGMLIARAAGVEVEIDDEIRANFAELKYLEKAIGETGQIAIMPLRRTSSRDLWQLTMLDQGKEPVVAEVSSPMTVHGVQKCGVLLSGMEHQSAGQQTG